MLVRYFRHEAQLGLAVLQAGTDGTSELDLVADDLMIRRDTVHLVNSQL